MQNVYIYYRVAQRAPAWVAAQEIMAEIREKTGVTGVLLQRGDDPATWMEVYEGVIDLDGFMAALDAAEAVSSIPSCLPAGAKRVRERFVPVPEAD